MILNKQGKLAAAIDHLKETIRKNSNSAIAYLYLSSLYEESKDLAVAEKILREGIVLIPRSPDLHYALGVIYEKENRFADSIKSMEAVLNIDPDNAEALNFIGYSYADRGMNLDEAEKMIQRAIQIKPDSGYMIDSLGWVHFKKNKFESAVKHLKRALELLPEDANIMEHLADVYIKTGQLKEAQELYRKALKIDPENKTLKSKLEKLIKSQ